jgi:hypothetical protein
MPKATQQYNLLVLNPSLAKEWHPTKNDNLNPMNVTPGSGKKVWWLCKEGHEWQAPIYRRTKGSSCPYCNKQILTDNEAALTTHSNLLKEWHPTKNEGLNPRNVTLGFNKKVWWICEEGYEWKATVKSRAKGKGCPVCNKVISKKSSENIKKILGHQINLNDSNIKSTQIDVDLPSSAPQMSTINDFRKSKRYTHQATVILEVSSSGHWSYAQTYNISSDGMAFETEVAFKPGTKIHVKFDSPPFKSAPDIFSSVVRWCRELADDASDTTYGVGVKFI